MEFINIKGKFPFKIYYVICIIIFIFPNIYVSLQVTNIVVPPIVDVREIVVLSCSYNMGTHKLNSVKWYKDNQEFYRFAPASMVMENMMFKVDGVQVSSNHVCNEKFCTINLEQLNKQSSGSYRCEISGDAPEFKLSHETANMTVAVLPRHDPIIVGIERNYYEGDFLFGNCTSDLSSPKPNLAWYINNEKAPTDLLQPVHENKIEAYGFDLSYRSLEIRFRIDKTRFEFINTGKIHMKCVSQIMELPSQIRVSNYDFFVSSLDELRNQKLTNRQNSGERQITLKILYNNRVGSERMS
ncbi:unnamed protein product [Diamesa hyperborea]